jgi:hypothetical protein
VVVLYGRAGRLTAKNGGFGPGQFGQTPDLPRLQSLVHQQLTGKELAADASREQAKERIVVAMRGRRVCLVRDRARPCSAKRFSAW